LYSKNKGINEDKLQESLSRTKSRIHELALCNPWELFVTLTINPNKYDRTDLKSYHKDLSQFLRNYSKKHGLNIKYLLIPELHDDNLSWHMHGFIMGLPFEHLQINNNGYLDWFAYSDKFGYMSLDKIKHQEKASSYIQKYITKDSSKSVTTLNAKMYYCSLHLNRKKELKKGTLKNSNIPYDYVNDYVNIKWLPTSANVENYFL